MIRFLLIVLLAPSLSGCWIYTNIEGNGSVKSIPAGSIDCKTGNAGDCAEEYDSGGRGAFVAAAEPGYSFSKWEGCLYSSIDTCKTLPWTEELAVGDQSVTVTAKFREQTPPVQAAQYTYNALGQRITKTIAGETTIFQYNLDGSLIAEIDALTGQPVRQHIHVNGEPVAQLSIDSAGAVTVQYIHADHLGTPTLLTDASRQVVADIEATPFGETYIDYAEVTHNRRFPGQYKDAESGLHYNYFRDYDPSLGRYIQSDPIGLQGGLNSYSYAYSNPLKYIDPFGLDAICGNDAVWIPNGDGTGLCRPFRDQVNQCASGNCAAFPDDYNAQSCTKCDAGALDQCFLESAAGGVGDCVMCAITPNKLACTGCAASSTHAASCVARHCSSNAENCSNDTPNCD
jgi:RHS repeat-associated protein